MLSVNSKKGFCVVLFWLVYCVNILSGKQPHILFILADDLGYNDVGYHNPEMFTPNIDQLAAEGVVLENYYVQPICTPTRSQLMTGRYQIHTGMQHSVLFAPQPNCLPLDEVLLPEKLRDAGYSNHIIGKWHLGFYKKECLPTSRGFDSFYGYYCGAEDYYSKMHHANCVEKNGTRRYLNGLDFHDDSTPAWYSTYSSYLYRDRAVDLVKNYDNNKPLFLYLPLQSVHFPLQVPEEYTANYKNVTNEHRRVFSAMVSALDDTIGHVINAFKERGMWDDTLTVFSTDNGGQTLFGGNNWPLRGRKASLWEGGVRGVGVVRGAGVQGKGRVSTELVHVSDWFPTLIRAAGANISTAKPLDSFDAWDAVARADGKSRRSELLHNIDAGFYRPYAAQPRLLPFPNRHHVNTTTGHAALRMRHWKLFTGDPGFEGRVPVPTSAQSPGADRDCLQSGDCEENRDRKSPAPAQPSVRLYDVVADPTESRDVARFFPEVVDEMLAKIAAYNRTAVPARFPAADCRSDPALQGGVWGPWM